MIYLVREDFSDRRMNADNDEPIPEYPSYRTEIPWDLTFAYSLPYNNNRRQRDLLIILNVFGKYRTHTQMEGRTFF